jgi:hypothetical protein
MKWSSAPLVLMTLLMALVTLAEEVASKNKARRGRGSKWWSVVQCIILVSSVAALHTCSFNFKFESQILLQCIIVVFLQNIGFFISRHWSFYFTI